MMSTSVHQYTPAFNQHPAQNMMSHAQHIPPQHMSTSGLDTLAAGSQYALQQLQQQQQQHNRHALANGKGFVKQQHQQQRHHPYANGAMDPMARLAKDPMAQDPTGRMGATGGPVRRRISRACDQCNQLRTKCDGKTPCAHCVEFGLTCEYNRERKKRGKASRKDIAAQQAAQAAQASGTDGGQGSPKSGNESSSEERMPSETPQMSERSVENQRNATILPPPSLPPPRSMSLGNSQILPSNGSFNEHPAMNHQHQQPPPNPEPVNGSMPTPRMPTNGMQPMGMGEYASMDDYHRAVIHPAANPNAHHMMHNGQNGLPHPLMPAGTMQQFGEAPYGMMSPGGPQQAPQPGFRMPTGESPMSNFLGSSPVGGSPAGWLSLPSPSAGLYPHQAQHIGPAQGLRYPVLQPVLPHIISIIPYSLACDLLDLYFQSSSSAFIQPLSPYILGYLFRKRSFLRQTNPRICSPALLASMLWIGAQTSEAPILTSPPSARAKICQKLMELTVSLLKPLIHTPASNEGSPRYGTNTVFNGVALGGFGVGMAAHAQDAEGGSPGATGALDDVATYIHLATVVSASEYKAASLRWWNAAWSLARELKLGRELPPNPPPPMREPGEEDMDADGEADVDVSMGDGHHHHPANNRPGTGAPLMAPPGTVPEEEREERRRIWWLLYIVDRHLALCYNRPLFLLDIECDGLLQPVDDTIWQTGDYYTGNSHMLSETNPQYFRRKGPHFEVTGHSIFGYFLPLMTILGEIVDLNHARNHPRFGLRFRNDNQWDDHASEIAQQLEAYGRSLQEFEARFTGNLNASNNDGETQNALHSNAMGQNGLGHAAMEGAAHPDVGTPSVHSVSTSGTRMTESILQTKVVVAYGTHIMHTLHILLNGKWDPISLLDDNDLWISSQSFISATGHAVSAAEAISDILEYDPDLSFMPFFFGIYLLQGSFLLLLIADKLQGEASPSVVKACETIVRAHEACVVTLNTEYQRNFRKVMRSALQQVRGRLLEDFGEQQLRRREVLALYRWTGDGTGLAL